MGASPYRLKDDPHSSHSVILARLGDGRGRKALDVGAADGFLSERLTAQGWSVTALERDPVLAARAHGRCKEVVVADLEAAPPMLNGPFETIVYGDVLEHLSEPRTALVALNRTLAPGGTVIVSVPNVAHLWMRLSLMLGRFDYTDRGILDRTHLRFFTHKSIRRMFEALGCEVLRLEGIHGRDRLALKLLGALTLGGAWDLRFKQIVCLARPRAAGAR